MPRWPLLRHLKLLLFTLQSLTYNTKTTRSVILDTAFEPAFWFIDTFAAALGPVFVFAVVCLISTVVITYYTSVLPVILHYHVAWIILHLVTAHWLLMNIVFNYIKVIFTSPGHPSKVFSQNHQEPITVLFVNAWINNCVGHFNHRYFIAFCVYMCLGTLYVTVASRNIFLEYFYDTDEDDSKFVKDLPKDVQGSHAGAVGRYFSSHAYHHSSVTFVFILSSAVTVALGLLTCWHARLIARGETSIEVHINRKKSRELSSKGLVYRNPYNYGAWQNWRILLGLVHGRSWICIILPSSHTPYGNGMVWPDPPEENQVAPTCILPV